MEIGHVIPAYKKDDTTNKKNFRPISLLTIISKLFEKLKYDQLLDAFLPIFFCNLSGFLPGHSCCSALLKMTDDWRKSVDNGEDVAVIAIDLSQAFDSICHNLLLAKLRVYCLSDSAMELMESYLNNRNQRVKANDVYSDWLPIQCGLPQGSLLASLLFNIFINDRSELHS